MLRLLFLANAALAVVVLKLAGVETLAGVPWWAVLAPFWAPPMALTLWLGIYAVVTIALVVWRIEK